MPANDIIRKYREAFPGLTRTELATLIIAKEQLTNDKNQPLTFNGVYKRLERLDKDEHYGEEKVFVNGVPYWGKRVDGHLHVEVQSKPSLIERLMSRKN